MFGLDFLFQPEPIIWIQQFIGYGHPTIFRVIDLFASTWGVLFVIGLGLWIWGRQDAYALAAIVVLEALINLTLNQFLSVPRPTHPAIVKYEHVSLGSFPSGHMFTVMVLWGLLWARNRVPLWLSSLIILGVGVGRLYLGVHYLADVVAGLLLGILLIWLFTKIWDPIREWFEERSYSFFVIAGVLGIAAAFAGLFFLFGKSHFLWNAVGVVTGGVIALLLEWRYVRFVPRPAGFGATTGKILLSLAGILPFLYVERVMTGENALKTGMLMLFLATLWALLVAPAWMVRLDLSRERIEERRDEAWHDAKVIVGSLLAIIAAVLIYGVFIEPRLLLDVDREPGPIAHLPAQWEGQEIAVLADFQSGLWLDNTGMMRRAVRQAIEERPAAVLLAGDFVYHAGKRPPPEVREIVDVLRPLAASGIPTFAVLGNHDWGLGKDGGTPNMEVARTVRTALQELGITVLHNQAVPLRLGGGDPLYIVGVGSRYADEDEPLDALREVPEGAARLIFFHHPDTFQEIPAGDAPLAVAGHTHGGQVRIPGLPEWAWLTFAKQDKVHADGWIDGFGAPGNRLYVNRGIGMSVVPMRINCPPELTIFTLRQGEPGVPYTSGNPIPRRGQAGSDWRAI